MRILVVPPINHTGRYRRGLHSTTPRHTTPHRARLGTDRSSGTGHSLRPVYGGPLVQHRRIHANDTEASVALAAATLTHRKDTTMEDMRKVRTVKLMEALGTVNRDRIVDYLVDEGLVERVLGKPKQPSILDEEWWLDDGGAIVYDHAEYSSPRPIELHHFTQEIAALPDALRALVEIQLLLKDVQGTYGPLGDINSRRNAVTDALKKAGIE